MEPRVTKIFEEVIDLNRTSQEGDKTTIVQGGQMVRQTAYSLGKRVVKIGNVFGD